MSAKTDTQRNSSAPDLSAGAETNFVQQLAKYQAAASDHDLQHGPDKNDERKTNIFAAAVNDNKNFENILPVSNTGDDRQENLDDNGCYSPDKIDSKRADAAFEYVPEKQKNDHSHGRLKFFSSQQFLRANWLKMVIVLVATVLLAGTFLIYLHSESGYIEPDSQEQSAQLQTAKKDGSETAQSPDTALTDTKIFVHIVGQVHSPGLYELQTGSRIADAIDIAGGATEKAQLEAINLAQILSDGQQLVVPDSETAKSIANSANSGASQSSAGTQRININSADSQSLQTLPGIGPALAERIITHRKENGPFTTVEQLQNVRGIGQSIFAELKEQVVL